MSTGHIHTHVCVFSHPKHSTLPPAVVCMIGAESLRVPHHDERSSEEHWQAVASVMGVECLHGARCMAKNGCQCRHRRAACLSIEQAVVSCITTSNRRQGSYHLQPRSDAKHVQTRTSPLYTPAARCVWCDEGQSALQPSLPHLKSPRSTYPPHIYTRAGGTVSCR